ncbi:trypsin-like peptidase domain-containing protein [Micromonospora sp. C28SCA-DRY-2]|uniref:trypsin-like peptidase domain-containing protein n=1 Tax=Micromonospora sp. C28SCA-DRY-2 TaxID=3059522 RepID=UPI002675947D|nr:trypsin-like peptidase domain-containing protein [Micromonospora sp. C28SCA-DRY-2]MDO3700862.1 trypsin-like peptidase domain-containing protein [Micromonospora sp. C28SCA-DRY-2]
MQPVGPYRFTHVLGGSVVGKAWAAIDSQGRFVTVAVLEGAAATDPRWREAFAAMADSLAQQPGGQAYAYADFSADSPWVAYPSEAGPGAEKLLRALGADYQPVPTDIGADMPVSGAPQTIPNPPQPVSGAPQPTSGAPVMPWAIQVGPVSAQPVSPQPVSAQPASAQPVSAHPVSAQPVSGTPQSPGPHATAPAEPTSYDPFAAPDRRIKPSEPRPRRTGLWLGISALVLVLLAGVGGVIVWAGSGDDKKSPPPYTLEERAVAIASPSLVYVEVVYTGYLRDKATKTPLRAAPVTFNRRCSGFVVSTTGHAFTNGLCVRPAADTATQNALYTLGRILIEEKKLESGKLDEYVATNLKKSVFTGLDTGQEPEVRLFGQFNVAKGNVTDSPAIPGEIVRTWDPEMGNVALVKFAQERLPVAELNTTDVVQQGTQLVSVGYATSDKDPLTATYTVASKPVIVASSGSVGQVSGYRVNGDVGIHSRGGLVIDTSGRVAGILDNDEELPDKANRAVVPAATLAAMLGEAGVTNQLGDTDRLYRSGLDAYFAGDYADAITRLSSTTDSSPTNLVAQTYRQHAADRQKIGNGD